MRLEVKIKRNLELVSRMKHASCESLLANPVTGLKSHLLNNGDEFVCTLFGNEVICRWPFGELRSLIYLMQFPYRRGLFRREGGIGFQRILGFHDIYPRQLAREPPNDCLLYFKYQMSVNGVSVFVLSCLVKCLTLNEKLYFSTDFEVHRNWLALTHSLPFSQWYKDARNVWTLDYPPFFAYFEYVMSLLAKFVDPEMVNVDRINYASFNTIVFQRVSVIIISDGLLALGTWMILPHGQRIKGLFLTLFSSSLFIVDHIHFQYNGMLIGLLLMSAVLVQNKRFYAGAILYMILIYLKHIYLFCAPVYFVYFLRNHVLSVKRLADRIKRLTVLVLIILGVSFIALYPLIHTNQLGAAFKRMFPFERGLTHSYWAPNVWAIYSFADRFLGMILGLRASSGAGSSTAGMVGVTEMLALPNITPRFSIMVTLCSLLPLLMLVRNDKRGNIPFITWIGLGCAFAFEFGWHVHEKAVLMVVIPLLMGRLVQGGFAVAEWDLSVVACASLLPLLPRFDETPLKLVLFITGLLLDSIILDVDVPPRLHVILIASVPEIYRLVLHPVIFGSSRYEFLPLMMNSVVSAVLIMGLILKVILMCKSATNIKAQ